MTASIDNDFAALERLAKRSTSPRVRSAAWVLAGNLREYLKSRHPICRKFLLADIEQLEAAMPDGETNGFR